MPNPKVSLGLVPSAWSNLEMTMRTNPEIDNLSIDDLYNNLRVFEQEIQGASKASSSAQNVALVSQSKSSTNKVKSGFSGAYSTCTPSTSSTNVPEKEVLVGFTDEVIYSLFAKQTEDLDLLHEDLEQINDVDIEEIDINWQIQWNVHQGHRRIRRRVDSLYQHQEARSKIIIRWVLLTMDDVNCTVGENILKLNKQIKHLEDFIGKPLYSRFTKSNDFKGVPHPLSGDYTPRPQEEIDDSLYVYGKKGPQKPEISVSDDSSSEHSNCQSNDSEGSCENASEHSLETESESLCEPNEISKSRLEVTNEKDVSAPKSKEVEPSCVSHIKTPRQPLKDTETHKVNRKSWNDMMERELGEGYSFTKKKCFVCGSLNHLIKDCDYYEKKMAREVEVKRVVNTGNGMAKPPIINSGRETNVNSVRSKVNAILSHNHNWTEAVSTKHATALIDTLSVLGKFDRKSDEGFLVDKPNVKGVGYRWMFDIDYLSDSMNYIPVSLENQTNNAGTSQTPESIASEEHDEEVELIVVPSTMRNTEGKAESRKSSTNSKKEEILPELQ
ncbi:hypothetical protein Tco_1103734 [Tanacetum coccineum]